MSLRNAPRKLWISVLLVPPFIYFRETSYLYGWTNRVVEWIIIILLVNGLIQITTAGSMVKKKYWLVGLWLPLMMIGAALGRYSYGWIEVFSLIILILTMVAFSGLYTFHFAMKPQKNLLDWLKVAYVVTCCICIVSYSVFPFLNDELFVFYIASTLLIYAFLIRVVRGLEEVESGSGLTAYSSYRERDTPPKS